MKSIDLIEYFNMADAIMEHVTTDTMSRVEVMQNFFETMDALMVKYPTESILPRIGKGDRMWRPIRMGRCFDGDDSNLLGMLGLGKCFDPEEKTQAPEEKDITKEARLQGLLEEAMKLYIDMIKES